MNKQAWIEYALQQGMESLEIYQAQTSQRSVTWFDHKVDAFTTSSTIGTSIRGVYQKKMANMAFEEIHDDMMEDVIFQLIEQAQTLSTKEEDTIVTPKSFTSVTKEVHWVSADMTLIKETLSMLEKRLLEFDPRIIQVNELDYQEASGTRMITNSLGLDVRDEDHMQAISAYVVAKEGNDVQVNYEVEVVEDLSQLDPDAFVKKVCTPVLKKLNAKSIPSQTMPVIFDTEAMTSLFSAFTGLFNGELIYKGISCLKDKLNEKVFSEKITIVDDPRNTDCLSIANFDDEGYPTRRKVLIENGIFKTALHSVKSAARMNTESTGNGFKPGYLGTISVSPMNCCIMPQTKSLEELCEDMKDGLVITDLQGLHAGIDFVTTDFSLQASGYLVKNGKRDQSVTLITVAGNFMALMNNVVEVGGDLDWTYHQVISPSIYFKNCAISGE